MEAPKTPVQEKKPLVVPNAPKKATTHSVDEAIATGRISVKRGESCWGRIPVLDFPIFDNEL